MVPGMMMDLYVCFGLTALGAITLLVTGIVCYISLCIRWRRRVAEVREGQPVSLGWNLKKLKETVRELEYEKVSRMELIL